MHGRGSKFVPIAPIPMVLNGITLSVNMVIFTLKAKLLFQLLTLGVDRSNSSPALIISFMRCGG